MGTDVESSRPTLEIAIPIPQELPLALHEPTGGGGALATIGGRTVQLTLAQRDLVVLLAERILAERDADPEHRGFVSIDELRQRLSLESPDASADTVRQLVRRVRGLLVKAGVGDLIESKRHHGYRLRVMPRIET